MTAANIQVQPQQQSPCRMRSRDSSHNGSPSAAHAGASRRFTSLVLPNLAVLRSRRRLAAPLARPPPGSALGRPPGTGASRWSPAAMPSRSSEETAVLNEGPQWARQFRWITSLYGSAGWMMIRTIKRSASRIRNDLDRDRAPRSMAGEASNSHLRGAAGWH
jgi:hypothetical protein